MGSLSRRAFLGGSAAFATATDLRGIDHVVLLMQENRSFDHYFGVRPGVRGYADVDVVTLPSGKPVWYQPTDDFLERRFGVEVPNLSDWRRETVGDLTSTLDFTALDTSVPDLPGTVARAEAVRCTTLASPTPPTDQLVPA